MLIEAFLLTPYQAIAASIALASTVVAVLYQPVPGRVRF